MTTNSRMAAHLAILGMGVCAHGATPQSSLATDQESAAPEVADSGSTPRSIHLSADLTRDGRPEDITIEFLQRDIQKAFSWVISVRNADGKVIYFDPHDDEGLEEVFSEPEHAGDCSDYEECKRRHYFILLPRVLGRCLQRSATPFLDDQRKEQGLDQAARSELQGRSLDQARIDAAISEMKMILSRPGYVALCVPEGPHLVSSPMIWVEAVQRFVTYYRPGNGPLDSLGP